MWYAAEGAVPSPSELARRDAAVFERGHPEYQAVKRPVSSESCAYIIDGMRRCGIIATGWRIDKGGLFNVLYPVCEGHRETS